MSSKTLVRSLQIFAFALLLLTGCTFYSTREILDGTFIPSTGLSYKFTVSSTLLTYTQTKLTLEARNGNGAIVPYHKDDVNITVTGTGSLDVISQTTFTSGKKDVYIRYNKALAVGQTELILLKAVSVKTSSITGASDAIVALPPGFNFATPTTATPATAFSVSINARAADGGVNSAYNGTVKLSYDNAVGSVSPATLTLANGTATANVTFTGTPNAKFRLIATDQTSATITGTSSDICMGCGLNLSSTNDYFLNLISVPISATQNRLSWNKLADATGYYVYKKISGSFVQQGTLTGNTFFNDMGLATGSYDYRVDAVNGSAAVIATATVTGTPAACVTTVSANITTPTVWSSANSPVCITTSISMTGAATLTINPGVTVLVAPNAVITVTAGFIQSLGSASQPVIFTSSHATDPTANRWGDGTNAGIVISGTSAGTQFSLDGLYTYTGNTGFQYTFFEYSTRAMLSAIGIDLEYDVFRHNRVTGAQNGAAFYYQTNTGSVVLRSNMFNNNSYTATSTRAAVNIVQTGTTFVSIVDNNIFSNNASWGDGGGMFFQHVAQPKVSVTGNYFYKNSTTINGGGGGMYYYGGNTTYSVQYNSFIGNTSGTIAGGMILFLGGFVAPNATLQYNYFAQNTATTLGGGLYLSGVNSGGASTVRYNRFVGNAATNGGALNMGDAASPTRNSQISQNTFIENTAATSGGSIYLNVGTNNTNTFSRNYFNNTTGGAFTGVIYDGAPANDNTWTGNSFVISGVTNIFVNNGDTTAYAVGANWWGQTVSGAACDTIIPAGICSTNQAGKPSFAAQMSSAPPLCSDLPSAGNCVGAP